MASVWGGGMMMSPRAMSRKMGASMPLRSQDRPSARKQPRARRFSRKSHSVASVKKGPGRATVKLFQWSKAVCRAGVGAICERLAGVGVEGVASPDHAAMVPRGEAAEGRQI
jgi:hypothetical protein